MFCWRSRGSALEASVQSWSDAIVIRAASAACRTAPCPSANFSKRGYKDLCSTCAKAPEPPPTRASAAARVKTRQSTVTNAALHSYVRGAERPTSPGGARAETQSSDDCGVDIFEPSRSSAETGPSFDGASSSCCGAVVGRRQARLARTSSAMYSAMTTNSSFCCCQVPLKTSSGTSAASYSSESCGFAAAQPKTSSTTANLARRSATTELLPLRDASARSACVSRVTYNDTRRFYDTAGEAGSDSERVVDAVREGRPISSAGRHERDPDGSSGGVARGRLRKPLQM
mmetsp:Transcript_18225/g.62687  ORF Transcript_18225/g.62687 Transcript_18225/m.62687 type:complete len:287 (-) Transcript_18225:79-939(-)